MGVGVKSECAFTYLCELEGCHSVTPRELPDATGNGQHGNVSAPWVGVAFLRAFVFCSPEMGIRFTYLLLLLAVC